MSGVEASAIQDGANFYHTGNPAYGTGDWNDENPGNIRAGYVLSSHNLKVTESWVFWPTTNVELSYPNSESDHHLVWIDVKLEAVVEYSYLEKVTSQTH